jgi:hypothetical protein
VRPNKKVKYRASDGREVGLGKVKQAALEGRDMALLRRMDVMVDTRLLFDELWRFKVRLQRPPKLKSTGRSQR